jgi:conserved oligomeric Golgi complex subunit 6
LQTLRNESKATIEQIQAANRTTLDSLKNNSSSSMESTISDYTKKINILSLELKATKEDLAKSKAVVEVLRSETESIAKQRDEARASASAPSAASAEHQAEVARLTKELSNAKNDLASVTETLNLTKTSIQDMSNKHQKDVQEAAQTRADELIKMRAAHDEEVASLAAQKSELLIKLSDMQGELATAQADLAAAQSASPKTNGASHPLSPTGVTKEDLAKLHEAHNLKIHDLEATHEKALKALREELDAALEKSEHLNADVARKAMEIQYLEQEQDENQEQIRQ